MRAAFVAASFGLVLAAPALGDSDSGVEREARDAAAAASAVMTNISEQPAIEVTPGYSNTPPETAIGGSEAERAAAVEDHLAGCVGAASVECEALATVRADEAHRQGQPSMEDDQEISAAQSLGSPTRDALGAGYSACTPQTQSVGTITYDTQSCHDYYLRVLDQQCTKIREVTVSWSCRSGAEGTFNYPNGDYYCTRELLHHTASCEADETLIGSGLSAQCEAADGSLRPADIATETEIREESAVPTVTDVWINPCAGREGRVPVGLLLPDGDNTPPAGGLPNGRLDKCERVNSVCSDEFPKSRFINRLWVTRQCWAYTNTFNCVERDERSDCDQPRFGACTMSREYCDDRDNFDPSICTLWTKDFRCVASDTRRDETVMSCAGQTYSDHHGIAWETGYPRDQDFGPVVSYLEAARQAGKYNQEGAELFKGFDNRCRKKLFGLVNCCNRSGGPGAALNNLSLAMQAGGTISALSNPSPWTFDALFGGDDGGFVERGFAALTGGDFTALAGIFGGNFSVQNVVSTLSPSYWTLAVMSISAAKLMSCDEDEKALAMKRDTNLCVDHGSYCSKKLRFIGTCIERTRSFCCYNSILAKLISTQGKAQLGQAPGTARRPNCGGFTAAELQGLDLARMDLREFHESISTKPIDAGATNARVDVTDCYFGEGQCASSRSTP